MINIGFLSLLGCCSSPGNLRRLSNHHLQCIPHRPAPLLPLFLSSLLESPTQWYGAMESLAGPLAALSPFHSPPLSFFLSLFSSSSICPFIFVSVRASPVWYGPYWIVPPASGKSPILVLKTLWCNLILKIQNKQVSIEVQITKGRLRTFSLLDKVVTKGRIFMHWSSLKA